MPSFLSSLSALKAVCIGSANLYGTLPSFHPNVVDTMMQLRLDNNALTGWLVVSCVQLLPPSLPIPFFQVHINTPPCWSTSCNTNQS